MLETASDTRLLERLLKFWQFDAKIKEALANLCYKAPVFTLFNHTSGT